MNSFFSVFSDKTAVNRIFLSAIPVLAAAGSFFGAVSVAVISFFTAVLTALLLSALKKLLSEAFLMPAALCVTAALTGIAGMLFSTLFPASAQALALSFPLIAVSGMILNNADTAYTSSIREAVVHACGSGVLFSAVLLLTGLLREIIGSGRLFGLVLTENFLQPIAFAATPAGGLFVLAVLAALYNLLLKEIDRRKKMPQISEKTEEVL